MPFYNHNDHYAELLLRWCPPCCKDALDVGCGDGRFTRRIAQRGATRVTGIDPVRSVIAEAQTLSAGRSNMRWVEADFLTHDFGSLRFDFISAVASIHHMPFDEAVGKMSSLLRPRGSLAILGLARSQAPADLATDLLAVPVNTYYAWRRQTSPSSAPAIPPTMTMQEVRGAARRVIPGARTRRLLLWRYLLTWTKPADLRRSV